MGLRPMFTDSTMPVVSPTVRFVTSLSVQFFVFYTLLFIVRTFNVWVPNRGAMIGFQKILETAFTTVMYAPMLCVLFLAARMRALQLTGGKTEQYGLPQSWVHEAMYCCTYSVMAQVALVVIVASFTGEMNLKVANDGAVTPPTIKAGLTGVKLLSFVRYLYALLMYGGIAAVMLGIFVMQPPADIWGNEALPVGPTVVSIVILTTAFFSVYLFVAIAKTAEQIKGNTEFLTKLNASLALTKYAVNFAPMLSIFFISARMRALQLDGKYAQLPDWAQSCFYLCAGSVGLQALVVLVMPFCSKCQCQQGICEGDIVFKMDNPFIHDLMNVVRYLLLAVQYGGLAIVIVSIFTMTSKEHGTQHLIGETSSCVLTLVVQYFLVYLVLLVCISYKQLRPGSASATRAIEIWQDGQRTVMIAPLLAVLFVAVEMQALQLGKSADGTIPSNVAPPAPYQDFMYITTYALIIQSLTTLFNGFMRSSNTTTSGRKKTSAQKMKEVGLVLIRTMNDLILTAAHITMYVCSAILITGIFVMTPETLPPYAHLESAQVPVPAVAPYNISAS